MTASPEEAEGNGLVSGLLAAALDVVTSFACVAYWCGVWSFLDHYRVSDYISGGVAIFLVAVLAIAGVDEFFEKRFTARSSAGEDVIMGLWTCLLAVLSILIWRISFQLCYDLILPQKDDIRAIVVTLIGVALLVATGRYPTASGAPPIGYVADKDPSRTRFAKAVFSGSKPLEVLIDLALTVPVVFVWAGVWMLGDNHSVPPLASGLCCSAIAALFTICTISDHFRAACEGHSRIVSSVLGVAWTSLLTLLVVGVWRGIWETYDEHLHLQQKHENRWAPHNAAGLAVAGAIGLIVLQRHRSALFPPMDFALDAGDQAHHLCSHTVSTAKPLVEGVVNYNSMQGGDSHLDGTATQPAEPTP